MMIYSYRSSPAEVLKIQAPKHIDFGSKSSLLGNLRLSRNCKIYP